MSGNPWIRFFPSDWLAGTRGMTASESGIYITLVALMYERGGEIENCPPRLCRLCGSSNSAFKRALENLISEGKITQNGNMLTNARVVEELSYTREKSSVARESANRRWGKKPNNNSHGPDANAMRTQCDGNANQKPEAIDNSDTRVSLVNGCSADSTAKRKQFPVQKAFDHYNIAADQFGLSKAEALTAERRRKIRVRLEEHGIDGWDRMLCQIENSEFLKGNNNRGWKATLDFFLQPSSFNKTIEGGYADGD